MPTKQRRLDMKERGENTNPNDLVLLIGRGVSKGLSSLLAEMRILERELLELESLAGDDPSGTLTESARVIRGYIESAARMLPMLRSDHDMVKDSLRFVWDLPQGNMTDEVHLEEIRKAAEVALNAFAAVSSRHAVFGEYLKSVRALLEEER